MISKSYVDSCGLHFGHKTNQIFEVIHRIFTGHSSVDEQRSLLKVRRLDGYLLMPRSLVFTNVMRCNSSADGASSFSILATALGIVRPSRNKILYACLSAA